MIPMHPFKRAALLTIAPVLFFTLSSAAQACASCGCTLTADWLSQGLAAQPGTTFTLRYDYVPQTTLQTGTRTGRPQRHRPPDGPRDRALHL